MDYTTASTDDIDSVVPEEYGGMWFFREPLDCENLGITLLELEPGGKGKHHAHAADGQEEVYLVVGGEQADDADEVGDPELTVRLGPEDDHEAEVTLEPGEAIRVSPETQRQLHNHSDARVRLVVAGAP
ncbi:cupin domain-containing protein [Natronomonas amylolytica]|uniref:cupin domain-containing protein n=1 Tax=Natronomonas amylolytica TaxID=3108498 RepID=UPI0030095DD6